MIRVVLSVLFAVMCFSASGTNGVVKFDRQTGRGAERVRFGAILMREWSKDPQFENKWRLKRTVALNPNDEPFREKMKADSIKAYERRALALKRRYNDYSDLLNRLGKPFESDRQKQLAKNLMHRVRDEKDKKNIEKDYNAGKVSKKLKDYIKKRQPVAQWLYEKAKGEYELIRDDWNAFYRSKGMDIPGLSYVVYTDTIENPYSFDYMYKLLWMAVKGGEIENYFLEDGLLKTRERYLTDKIRNCDGWEWLAGVDGADFETKSESYPRHVEYEYLPSHPQYGFKGFDNIPGVFHDGFVFDENGKLLRVTFPECGIDVNSKMFNAFLIAAYNANEMDIKSAGAQANHYVKTQLGLEKMTAAEVKKRDQAAEALGKAMFGSMRDEAKYGRYSKKGRKAQAKHGANMFGALLGAAGSGYYSDAGGSWIDQVREDYFPFLRLEPYDIERLDDTSFKVTYADANCNPTFEMMLKYSSSKPYEVSRQMSVKKLFNGPAAKYKMEHIYGYKIPVGKDHVDGSITAKAASDVQEGYSLKTYGPDRDRHEKVRYPEEGNYDVKYKYKRIDKDPEFPGGRTAMLKHIHDNLDVEWLKQHFQKMRSIQAASRFLQGLSTNSSQSTSGANANALPEYGGVVYVGFTVNEKGEVKDVFVQKGRSAALNKVAVDAVRSLPKFSPGVNNGKPVSSMQIVPVEIKLY